MLDPARLRSEISQLQSGNLVTGGEILRGLKAIDKQEWVDGPEAQIGALVHCLCGLLEKKPSSNFRQDILAILGNIGPLAEPAVPQLMEMLEEKASNGVREGAVSALGKIGKAAKPAVDKLLALFTPNCRASFAARVARALGEIGCSDQRVRTSLYNLWMLPISCETSRGQIAIALCRLKIEAPGLLQYITHTLVGNRNPALRAAAAEALFFAPKTGTDVVPALTAAKFDDDPHVCELAESALKQLKVSGEKAIEICCEQLSGGVHSEVALRKSGADAVRKLAESLRTSDSGVRRRAAGILSSIGEVATEAVASLKLSLKDKDWEVRLSAAKALWCITKDASIVVPTMTNLLEGDWPLSQEDGESRRQFFQTVIEALWRIGPPAEAAVPALRAKAKDANRLVRESAMRALKEIEPADFSKIRV